MHERPSICLACKWRSPRDEGDTCRAYPDGIPTAIMPGGFDHRQEYPDDRGIRFAVLPGLEPVLDTYERRLDE